MKKYTVLLLVLIGAFFLIKTSVKTQAQMSGYNPSRSVTEGDLSPGTELAPGDIDNDGVLDSRDNCPTVYNPEKIAFDSFRNGIRGVYTMNADGTNEVFLTSGSSPSFSPNGSKIAFASFRDGNSEIYVMDADGSNQRRLTNNPAFDSSPSFSPDGSKIVFVSSRGTGRDIYVMNSDGTNQVRPFDFGADAIDPSFSPDGSRIVFTCDTTSGGDDICLMNPDGTNFVNLTSLQTADDFEPSFSPDGSKIVFVTLRNSTSPADLNFEIYVMNSNGTNQVRLTNTPSAADEFEPSFSPDGSKIVFESDRDGNDEIYVMNPNGTNPVRLTNNSVIDAHPSWGAQADSDNDGIGDACETSQPSDSTPPVITPTVAGTLGDNGWYISDAQVSWSVTDDESTVSGQTGCETQTVTTDTNGVTFTCSAQSAGGSNSQSVTIKRDATAPSITFSAKTMPNANGWNNSNVAVEWNCADTTSGAVSSSVTTIVSAEGANQSAMGICTDNAGNTASNTQTGIKIDKTAPSITFDSLTPAANANGWNNTDVAVKWNCADALSGANALSVNQTVSAEGANQQAMGTCSDLAGNSASDTQNGINIDKTAPAIAFVSLTPAANANGWNNSNVIVNWNCSDTLSGVVNSAISQTVSAEGANLSSAGQCFDLAGNSASNAQTGIKIDKTAPTIALVSRTAPNANGWNNTNVTVSWSCSDALSGAASPGVSQTLTNEGINLSATGQCFDVAGNSASNTQTGVNIDKTAPTITFNSRSPAPNANGWNNSDVTINWNCGDALSGAANQSVSQILTQEGVNLSAVGTCFDVAGNSASNMQSGIKIDKTAPVIAPLANITVSPPTNSTATSVAVNFPLPTASDNFGTAAVATNPVSGLQFPVGTTIVNVTATDAAGNVAMSSFTVSVRFRFGFDTYFSGFRPNQLNQVTAGSEVSVIFSLSGNKGASVYSALPASQRINCANGTPTGAIEPIMTMVNYDPIYNAGFDVYSTTWKTRANYAGTCRQLTLFLKDGTTQTLDFRFR